MKNVFVLMYRFSVSSAVGVQCHGSLCI